MLYFGRMLNRINGGIMNKYENLLKIIDEIRKEAPSDYRSYYPLEKDIENINKARSKAFIHLFLKVKFGLLDFLEREKLITEGIGDGGIDAYYIDKDNKKIYFIQAKFRTNETSFESREITLRELLKMDINRITKGYKKDGSGNNYNSKIIDLVNEFSSIGDIGRYDYKIIILANIRNINQGQLKRLTGGFVVEKYNFDRCYRELLFPIIKGDYYSASDIFIYINLANIVSPSSNISYIVKTEYGSCNIDAIFVPTVEIAKILLKYKNTILKYNPRSYLDLSNNPVNKEISKTILERDTNEFALFNNGITMLSDNTEFSRNIGKKDAAQLIVTNPQIINGGQTAYTLSKIYNDILKNGKDLEIFNGKEVLLKVITFKNENSNNDDSKLELIEEISQATNQQTTVTIADRRSNDKELVDLQEKIFNDFGYYFERKRGEFWNGITSNYVNKSMIINRESFIRICYACNNRAAQARRSSENALFKDNFFEGIFSNFSRYKEYFFAYKCYVKLEEIEKGFKKFKENKFGQINYGNALRYGKFAVISVVIKKYNDCLDIANYTEKVSEYIDYILKKWLEFEKNMLKKYSNKKYFRKAIDEKTGEEIMETNYDGYYKGSTLDKDLSEYNFS